MRKLLIALVLLALCGIAQAPQKPMLGELSDASQFEFPVGIWVMNEGSGILVNDLSGNRKDGTLLNGPTWDVGKYDSAVRLSGGEVTEDHIDIGDESLYEFGDASSDKPFTFVVGYTPDLATVNHPLVYKFDDVSPGTLEYTFSLAVDSGLEPRLQVFDDGASDRLRIYGTPIANPTGFHILAATYDGSGTVAGMKLYVDGREQAVTDESQGSYVAMHTSTAHLRFGAAVYDNETYDNFADGRFEFVIIFDNDLTAAQIAQLYIESFPWFIKEPIKLWESAIAVPTGGQVIFINFSSLGYGFGGLGLMFAWLVVQKLKNRKWSKL